MGSTTTSNPHPTGRGNPVRVEEAAGAIQPYRLVYEDGSNEIAVLSDTDQDTTAGHQPLGVYVGGGSGTDGAAVDGDTGLDVRTGAGVPLVAGTGGLSAGDLVIPEYSATAANQGRGISAFGQADPGMWIVGVCREGASAGDRAIVDVFPTQVLVVTGQGLPAYEATSDIDGGGSGTTSLTAAQCLGGVANVDPGGGAINLDLPTGSALNSAMDALGLTSFAFVVNNKASASEDITLRLDGGSDANASLLIQEGLQGSAGSEVDIDAVFGQSESVLVTAVIDGATSVRYCAAFFS